MLKCMPVFLYPSDPHLPIVRIPKLKIRNPSPINDVTRSTAIPLSFDLQERPSDVSSKESGPHVTSANSGIGVTKGPVTGALNAKSRSGVLGLLSLKEPSQSAWQDFVKEQKKLAKQQGGNSPAPLGVSKRKLPSTVPKVNSRWDGMPDVAHQRTESLSAKQSMDSGISGKSIQKSRSNSHSKRSHTHKKSSSSASRPSQSNASPARSRDSSSMTSSTQTASSSTTQSTPARSRATSAATASVQPSRPSNISLTLQSLQPTSLQPETLQSPTNQETFTEIKASAIPETSLFFPSETRVVIPTVDSPADNESSASAGSGLKTIKLPDIFNRPPSLTRQRLPPKQRVNSTSSEEDVPASSPGRLVEHSRSASSGRNREFRSIEDVPQWPLPTDPNEVIIVKPNTSRATRPQSPAKTISSSPGGGRGHTNGSVDGQYDEDRQQVTARPATVPTPPRPSRASLPSGLRAKTPVYAAPQPQAQVSTLRAPAHMPGRVVVKDSDLETIPESDTASILFRSPSPDRSKSLPVYDTNGENEDEHERNGWGDDELSSTAYSPQERDSLDNVSYFSRISSETIGANQDPRERLGLGKSIKFTHTPPWGNTPSSSKPGSPKGGSMSGPTSPVKDDKAVATTKKQVFSLFPKVKTAPPPVDTSLRLLRGIHVVGSSNSSISSDNGVFGIDGGGGDEKDMAGQAH